MDKASFLDAIHRMNPVLIRLLQSRLHWLASSGLMLVRYRGRKSGREIVTPVGLNRFDQTVIVLVSGAEHRQWWRNFREPWPVEVCLAGRWQGGRGCVLVETEDEYRYWLQRCLDRAPFMPRIFGLDYDKSRGVQDGDVARMAEYARIVRIDLE